MIQCAVNFSTSDINLIKKIVQHVEYFLSVADYSCDIDHNRSVVTLIGKKEEMVYSMRACGKFAQEIDLSKHTGAHPRMGSLDVVPFVPLGDETMETCVELAHYVGKLFWEEFRIPVFFYEEACFKEENRYLENIRKSKYKTLDLGKKPNPKLGAVCVGARCPLIAYNVNLETDNI